MTGLPNAAPTLDIRGDVCPMTFVKVKMGLSRIPAGGTLAVLLADGALKNVISSLKQEGHRVAEVRRQEAAYLLFVERKREGA